ncbi:IS4 family transposase, partial [Legionella shakespearei]
ECEWKAVYAVLKKTKPPQKPPTLHEMIIMIAKLGGFLARKSDGFPGPKVMWQGLQRMRDFSMAWITFHAMDEN